MVSDIHSWVNTSSYEQNINFFDIFKKNSVFYNPWSDVRDLEFYLHKVGHFTFYGSLSVFLFWKSTNRKTFLLKLILIAGFAFADEIHQYYVVGRTGRIMDVYFDMASAMFCLALIFAFGKAKKESKVKRQVTAFNSKKRYSFFKRLKTEN